MSNELLSILEKRESEISTLRYELSKYKAQLMTLQGMANIAKAGYNPKIQPDDVVTECLRIKL